MKRNILYAGALLLALSWNAQALTDQDRILAATATAEGSADGRTSPAADCAEIQPFWWEIGYSVVMRVGDTSSTDGSGPPFQDTDMAIASASKWIYAAYVAERRGGDPRGYDIQFLTLESGYHYMSACNWSGIETVDECLAYFNVDTDHANGDRDSTAIGKFAYDGGHFEAHASNYPGLPLSIFNPIDLGAYNDDALTAEINGVLDLSEDVVESYGQPLLAGGVRSTPGLYADFLRAIMSGNLEMYSLLGMFQVCASKIDCPDSVLNTPIPDDHHWNYSVGHWVETDNDNAYSNAGVRGFYAWISKYKDLYGIVGRDVNLRANETEDTSVNWDSVECGQLIRKAWYTGQPQP